MGTRPCVRVLTMNVLGPANPDWDRRRALLAETFRRLDPDVVALQEVPCDDGFEVVEQLLGSGYGIRGFAREAEDGVGGVLASRWPMRVLDEIDQRTTPRSRDFAWCSTLIVELDAPVG